MDSSMASFPFPLLPDFALAVDAALELRVSREGPAEAGCSVVVSESLPATSAFSLAALTRALKRMGLCSAGVVADVGSETGNSGLTS
jgi:hypothetical protein